MDIIKWLTNRGINIKNDKLIRQAFMHSSYANEHKEVHDNERLEFMGDAVLQLWSSDHIFPLDPPLSEGQMTRLRAQLVCEEKTGGRNKDAIVADMFEAFLGALYLDQGMKAVDNILDEVIIPYLKHPGEVHVIKDYKTALQEIVQSDNRRTVRYQLVSESGPSNAPTFVMNVIVDDLVLGTGKGSSKKQAEQNAAKDAFDKMVR